MKINIEKLISGQHYAEKNFHRKGLISNLDSLITSANQSEEYLKLSLTLNKLNSIITILIIIFSISLASFSLIFIISFISKTIEIKNKVISYGNESVDYLKLGFNKLFEFDTTLSKKFFDESITSSNKGLKQLSPIKPLTSSLSILPGVKDYGNNASKSFEALKSMSNIGSEFSEIEKIIETEKQSKNNNYKIKIENSFIKIRDNLSSFEKNIYSIDLSIFPKEYQEKINALKKVYPELKNYLKQTEIVIKELPEVAGFYETKNYLIALENNNELRGSGGFIGSWGILSLEKNNIKDFYIKDVYLLDNPYAQAIIEGKEAYFAPPHPMDPAFTGNWALRDANINPDFSVASQTIEDFYLKEIKYAKESYPQRIDGVIAITPSFFEDILKIIGPVYLEQYNLMVSSDNLLETLQIEVEQGKDKQNNQNPKIILDFLKQKVLEKMANLKSADKTSILNAVIENLNTKNILFEIKNTSIARIFNDFNWSGKMTENLPEEDYLMVVNNNFGGGKSSLKVNEEISQKIDIKEDGTIEKTLKIKRTHTSDYKHLYYDPWSKKEMWLIGDNNNYTKIYVPRGSEIISSAGINQEIFKGEENKKTFFGFNFTVIPKQEKEISITYRLPFKIKDNKLKIFIDKQSGALPDKILTTINTGNNIKIKDIKGLLLGQFNILKSNNFIEIQFKK